jgi:hypothetical protein
LEIGETPLIPSIVRIKQEFSKEAEFGGCCGTFGMLGD